MWVTMPNLIALSEWVWVHIGSQKFVCAWASPLGMELANPKQTRPSPHSSTCWVWSLLVKRYQQTCTEIRWNNKWSSRVRLSRSLKSIKSDTDRSAAYEFLLVICSNYMDLYSTVSEINGGICVKCNFITHYPRKCATAFGFKIYNDGLLHGEKKSLTISTNTLGSTQYQSQ